MKDGADAVPVQNRYHIFTAHDDALHLFVFRRGDPNSLEFPSGFLVDIHRFVRPRLDRDLISRPAVFRFSGGDFDHLSRRCLVQHRTAIRSTGFTGMIAKLNVALAIIADAFGFGNIARLCENGWRAERTDKPESHCDQNRFHHNR